MLQSHYKNITVILQRGEIQMKTSVKKLLMGATVSTVILAGATVPTFAATKTKPSAKTVAQTTLYKQQTDLKQVMQFAKQGKVINTKFGIGTTVDTLFEKVGRPEYDGGLSYGDFVFFTKDGSYEKPVSSIVSKDKKITSIRYKTVKSTLGKPFKDIEYKGKHIVTYKAGNYDVTFSFPSLFSKASDQKNPKITSYSVMKTNAPAKTVVQSTLQKQQTELKQVMQFAKQGKVINTKFGIGTTVDTLFEKVGRPEYDGGLSYGDFEFFTKDRSYEKPVSSIVSKDKRITSIRYKTVKSTLGKPYQDKEYKGKHIVTYKSGKYVVTFSFPSLYSKASDQQKNPKITSYSVYK
jgi:Zn/Cd-binding protein ZinT